MKKEENEFLKSVERYGKNKTRYDLQENNGKTNETKSIFTYDYENKKVIIWKVKGEYTDYTIC